MDLNRKQFDDLTRGVSLPQPQLSLQKKAGIRASLLSNLSKTTNDEAVDGTFSWLTSLIGALRADVQINPAMRVRVKEKIFAKLEGWHVQLRPVGFSFMRLLSSTLVLTIFVGSAFFYGTLNVKAQTVTRLTEVDGEVYVMRDGHQLPAQAGMLLMQNDVVRTELEAKATIIYYDDSVTRLDSATEVKLDKLYLDKYESSITTQVVLSLNKGDLWVNVPSLAGDDSTFWVAAGDYMAEVVNRAAFHLKAGENQAYELGVFDSVVYVADKDNNKKPVANGYKLAFNDQAEVLPIPADEKDAGWVQDNINKDEQHLDGVRNKLIAEVKKEMGEEVTSFEGRLAEYEVLLSEKKSDQAKDKLIEIRQTVEGLLAEIDELAKSDAEQAKVLREQLNSKLALHHRILTLVAADIDSIEGKNVLYDVKLALAPTEEAKKAVEIEKATDVLLQVADALAENDGGKSQQVDEYVAEAQKIVEEEDSEESAGLLSVLENQRNSKQPVEEIDKQTTTPVDAKPINAVPLPKIKEPEVQADTLPPQFTMELDKDQLLEEAQ